MKYAILSPADQTVVYETENNESTTNHRKAKLWSVKAEAEAHCRRLNKEEIEFQSSRPDQKMGQYMLQWIKECNGEWFFIEEVTDEIEFRSRKDTW